MRVTLPHQGHGNTVPSAELQQALDTALERAPEGAEARFAADTRETSSPLPATADLSAAAAAHALTVAVAVVVDGPNVLLVQRPGEDGGGIFWQFPAGVVKPGVTPSTMAVRETLAETGVHCAVVRALGRRLHPITNVYCDYLLCEYLTGEVQNVDVVENVSVTWAAKDKIGRFMPVGNIFPPILQALEVDE